MKNWEHVLKILKYRLSEFDHVLTTLNGGKTDGVDIGGTSCMYIEPAERSLDEWREVYAALYEEFKTAIEQLENQN